MQKNLKAKLEKFSREQLLELLEELGNVPEVQKIIKAMDYRLAYDGCTGAGAHDNPSSLR